MADEPEPLLAIAAKRVAEGRQHGCHYAEGTCPECLAIAESVLRAVITKELDENALEHMRRAWSATGASMRAAYRAMPIWRVLWGE